MANDNDDLRYTSLEEAVTYHNWKTFTQAAARTVLNLEVLPEEKATVAIQTKRDRELSRMEAIALEGKPKLDAFEFSLSCGGSRGYLDQCTFTIEPEVTSKNEEVQDKEGNVFVKVNLRIYASFQGMTKVDTDQALEFAEVIRKGTEALRVIRASQGEDVYWCVEMPADRERRDADKRSKAQVKSLIEKIAKQHPKVGDATMVGFSEALSVLPGTHKGSVGRRQFTVTVDDSGCSVERVK